MRSLWLASALQSRLLLDIDASRESVTACRRALI